MKDAPPHWFPAKRFGRSWGLPICWQGWAVLLGFLCGMLADCVAFEPAHQRALFNSIAGILLVAFSGVVYWKGESRHQRMIRDLRR